MKSPLRYPGGKTRAVHHITPYFPKIETLVSPFFGGGSIEISQLEKGVTVKGYDVFEPLVTFWKYLISDPVQLHQMVSDLHPMSKEDFVRYRKANPSMAGLEQAAVFYALNRCSFSGSTLSGGMSKGHARFNQSNMETLLRFNGEGLSVEVMDYRESLARHSKEFLYLDPPYLLKKKANKLYGVAGSTHRDFNHDDLFELLKDRPNWIMSYNSGSEILKRYADFPMAFPKWNYAMSKDKASREVLILSKDLAASCSAPLQKVSPKHFLIVPDSFLSKEPKHDVIPPNYLEPDYYVRRKSLPAGYDFICHVADDLPYLIVMSAKRHRARLETSKSLATEGSDGA